MSLVTPVEVTPVKPCNLQELAGLLGTASPCATLQILTVMEGMVHMPDNPEVVYDEPNALLDKMVCLKMVKNKAVAEPLLSFVVRNLVEVPQSDLECVAFRCFLLLQEIWKGARVSSITTKGTAGRMPPDS